MELCWLTTEKCNQNCKYCDRFLEQGNLSTEDYLNILKKLISYGVKKLTFGGGESLILDCFKDIVKKAADNEIKLKLVTNGNLIPQNVDLIPCFNEITLSLDAAESSINHLLGRGNDHFNNVRRAVAVIKEHGSKVKININSVVTKINIDEIKNLTDSINEWNIHQWRIFRFCPLRGTALHNRENFEISNERFLELCQSIQSYKTNCEIQFRNYEDMEKGYLLITPKGKLCVSRDLKDVEVGDMLKDDLKQWFE